MNSLTWFELSRVKVGARVIFVDQHDIYPECIVAEGTLATVVDNSLNEMHCGISVLPDNENIREVLAHWNGVIHIDPAPLDPAADGATDPDWQAPSPLALITPEDENDMLRHAGAERVS